MNYRAVKNRCAVDLASLKLPISTDKALTVLKRRGFKLLSINMIALARQCIKTSHYRRGARLVEAPHTVDCSSFVKWLYSQRGIWLPRRSIQQRELGIPVAPSEIRAEDVVFVKGAFDWYWDNPKDGVGHVGIATGEGTVIHAADSESNVIESPYREFVGELKLRGIRRYIHKESEVITLEIPPNRDVEISDDFRWIILQSLPR